MSTATTTRARLVRLYPLILFWPCLAAVAAAAVRETLLWPDPVHVVGSLLALLYLGWLLLELRTTVASSDAGHTETDRGTVLVYGAARLVTAVAAFHGGIHWEGHQAWMPLAVVALLAGIALRVTAIRALGRFYSHKVRTVGDHRVVTSGPYRFVRHPAYTGMALSHVALVAFFLNTASAAALVALLLPALVMRILVEERVLATVSGWTEYAAGRRRLVPYVW